MAVKEGTLAIDGAEIFFRSAGTGTPILLIHGTGADADTWGARVFNALAADHQVIAFDRRSYSRSTGRPLNDIGRHASDAAALLRHLADAPATVVGWSSGGTIALRLAAENPELVRALVLEEPVLPWMRTVTPSIISALFTVRIAATLRRRPDAAAESFYRWAGSNAILGNSVDRLSTPQQEAAIANAPAAVAEMNLLPWEAISVRAVKSIGIPTVILIGGASRSWYARVGRRLADLLPHSSIVVAPDSSHYIHVDDPARFVAEINRVAPTGDHHAP